MKIVIHTGDEGVNKVTFEDVAADERITYDDLLAIFLGVMESATLQFIEKSEATKEDREHLYDVLDTLFFTFMERTFPDIQPREFDFSDAAVLYAQDKIIEEADEQGITFEEAMKRFEDKARAYVQGAKS